MKYENVAFKNQNDLRDQSLRKGFVEAYYDWRYHYEIAAGEGISGSNAFVWEQLPDDVIPKEPIWRKIITFLWFMILLRVDFRIRTKTSFRKMTTVTWRNSHMMM